MTFVTPLLLAGTALIAIPIILHLIMRRKPKLMEFPALRFVQKRHDKNKRSLRLRHIILALAAGGDYRAFGVCVGPADGAVRRKFGQPGSAGGGGDRVRHRPARRLSPRKSNPARRREKARRLAPLATAGRERNRRFGYATGQRRVPGRSRRSPAAHRTARSRSQLAAADQRHRRGGPAA